MKTWFKKHWPKIIGFLGGCWAGFKLFIKWPTAAVTIATIPLHLLVGMFLPIGAVAQRLTCFIITLTLFALSWHVGELIVLLCGVAVAIDFTLLVDAISKRIREDKVEATA